MTTFRTTVTFDFAVPDGVDADEFHDVLRDALEDHIGPSNPFGIEDFWPEDGDQPADEIVLETVRDINVEELDD
jgi:hypothetical protein